MSKRIVITGDRGFVGSNTKEMIAEMRPDWEVVGYDLVDGLDIRDYEQLKNFLKPGDKILHMAGYSTMKMCEDDASGGWHTNVGGTINVSKAAREVGCDRVIFSSTGTTFAPIAYVPMDEIHPQVGVNEYGWTKIQAEKAMMRYAPNWIILRYAHISGYGKRWGVVESFRRRIERGLQPTLFGGGTQSKDFVYIKDICLANILALETEHTENTYNIGTGEELNVKEAFDIMSEVFGWTVKPADGPPRFGDPLRMVFSTKKSKKYLGYVPKYSFKESLIDMMKEEEGRKALTG